MTHHSITITINTGSAAFANNEREGIAWLLSRIPEQLDVFDGHLPDLDGLPLLDVNGNRVGVIHVAELKEPGR